MRYSINGFACYKGKHPVRTAKQYSYSLSSFAHNSSVCCNIYSLQKLKFAVWFILDGNSLIAALNLTL
jgi:hypothetical protein